MKKYSVLLAIVALIIASLACKTVMGGGTSPSIPGDNGSGGSGGSGGGGAVPTADSSSGGGVTVGGGSEFPMPSDAANVVSVADPASLTYQTKLSADDVMKFYRDEFGKKGYKEDTSMSTSIAGAFTMGFTGHSSGKKIVIAGAPTGNGTTTVTVTLQ